MIRRILLLGLAALVAGCATGGARPSAPAFESLVLARVNDEVITVQDLSDSFTASHQGHGAFLAGKDAVRTFLEKEIDKRLLLQEAHRVGVDEDREVKDVHDSLVRKRATEAFYKEQVEGKVEVTDAAIAAAHERSALRFDTRHILAESREAAEAARARVTGGEPFGEVARQVSRADSAVKGGDLGIVRWGTLDPVLEDRLWSMKTGDMSEPIETDQGWNVLYVVERVEVPQPKLEQAQALIKARLAQRQKEALARALHRRLLADAHAVTRPALLIDTALAGSSVPAGDTAAVAEGGGERIALAEVAPMIDPEGLRKVPQTLRERRIQQFLEEELARRLAAAAAVRDGYGDRPEFRREVERTTDEAMLNRFVGNVVLAKVSVDDQEAHAYWAANPKEFTEPRAVKLRVLFVDSETEANDIVTALHDGKDFAALARASKNPGIAAASGDLGWVTEGRLEPALEKVAFALPEGGVGVTSIGTTWIVVRTEEIREPRLRPFAEAREQARERAVRSRSQQTIKVWVTKLREASTIEVDEGAITRAIAGYEDLAREKERTKKPAPPGHGGDKSS
jgi:peptidyl-prolyl cis-trans isomerase C